MSIPWDQPGADPVADIKAALKLMVEMPNRPAVFYCPPALAKAWEAEHGRPLSVDDINKIGPGYWHQVVFA